jgi:integrase
MGKNVLPPNTRINHGCLQFRKQYKGQQIARTWSMRDKDAAIREIYDLLRKMSRNEELILELEHRMTVEEACGVYFKIHSPSLKVRESCMPSEQPAYNLQCRLNVIQEAWTGRFWDSLNKYDVRDLLKQFNTAGTKLKYLGTLTHMFKSYQEWNEEGNILKVKVKLPASNPATKWRKEMKSAQKKELPRTRVLAIEEWNQFKVHLTDRSRAICEMALRRFLRLADIKQISYMSIKGDIIEGIQQKTGERFSIPTLEYQPKSYDFTNFEREFKTALIAAQMDYPTHHSLHFTVRDLRRTGATWAYLKTKDLVGISKMLGHTKISTTIRYLNIDDSDKRRIAQAVDEMAATPVTQKLEKHLEKVSATSVIGN